MSYAKFHRNPSNMNGWYAAIKVLKNALCFIMGYLVAMVIRVMLFLLVQFFIWYIVQVKSMCVPILKSIGSELTACDAKTLWNQPEVSTTSGSEVMAQIVVFGDLDLDLWHMFFFFVTRIAHDVLEYICEVALESVQYEWVICCG